MGIVHEVHSDLETYIKIIYLYKSKI